jgi:hypothetical protein
MKTARRAEEKTVPEEKTEKTVPGRHSGIILRLTRRCDA